MGRGLLQAHLEAFDKIGAEIADTRRLGPIPGFREAPPHSARRGMVLPIDQCQLRALPAPPDEQRG